MTSTTAAHRAGRWKGRVGMAVTALLVTGGTVVTSIAPTTALAAPGDTIIYGANGYGNTDVVELNLTQQTFTHVGDVARETQAIDQDPATGRLYWFEWKTTSNEFGYWDPATGANTIVRVYTPRPNLYAKRLAFGADGVLYMMDADDRLFTIDKHNGNITTLGQVTGLENGPYGGTGDMAFAPDGTLYIATYSSLYAVDVATRTSTLLHDDMIDLTGVGITLWTGLAFCDGVLYASHAEEATALSAIFAIDPASGATDLLYYTDTLLNDLSSCSAIPPNDPPSAVGGSVATAEDTAVGVVLSASDPDDDPLTYTVVTAPTHGSLSGTAPNLTYTPNPNLSGPDSFAFRANDGTVDSNTATVTITVTAVNDAPVATNASATTTENTPVDVTLAASDIDDDPLTYTVVTAPTHGTLSGTAPNLTYTPNPGTTGPDTFTFRANDGTVNSNTATITITVDPAVVEPPLVASRATSRASVVSAPSGVTPADHVAIHTMLADRVSTPPTWTATPGFALRYQRTMAAGSGYYFHWAVFDSAGNDVSAPSTYSVSGGRTGLVQGTQAFRVVNTAGYAAAAADGRLSTSTLNLPTITPGADNALVVASISAGTTATISTGPAGWTQQFGESDDYYLYSLVTSAPTTPASTTTFSNQNAHTATVHAFLPLTPNTPPPNDPPSAPVGLSATARDGSVDLTWAAPTDDGGSALTDYVVQYRDRGAAWSTFTDGTGTTTATTVTGLTNYDEYEFRVAATTSAGTGGYSATGLATPTDGDDPNHTFNYPDGTLTDQVGWVPIAPVYGDLQVTNGHVVGTGDPQGTGTAHAQPVGADLEVTIDALLGADYNEVTAILRMESPNNLVGSYLLQWVTDGRYAAQGGITGPTLQIWRVDAGPSFALIAESSLPNHGERTLTFGANGSTLYIAEGSTVHLSHTDSTYATGDYFALGQSNLSGSTPSQIDNLRWRTLTGVQAT